MAIVTVLYKLGDDVMKAKYVKVDYLDTLALYIIRSSIGVKLSRELRFSREAESWRKWAEKFTTY